MILVMKVAGTMVSGWTVFGLTGRLSVDRDPGPFAAQPMTTCFVAPAAGAVVDQARMGALQAPSRQIRLAFSSSAPLAATVTACAPGGWPGEAGLRALEGAHGADHVGDDADPVDVVRDPDAGTGLRGLADRVDAVLLVFGVASVAGIWVVGAHIDRRLRVLMIAAAVLFAVAVTGLALTPLVHVAAALWGLAFGGVPTLL